MKKSKIYRYLSRDGMVTTPILIEGANPILMYRLTADSGKVLSNGSHQVHTTDVFEDELNDWFEISKDIEE